MDQHAQPIHKLAHVTYTGRVTQKTRVSGVFSLKPPPRRISFPFRDNDPLGLETNGALTTLDSLAVWRLRPSAKSRVSVTFPKRYFQHRDLSGPSRHPEPQQTSDNELQATGLGNKLDLAIQNISG